MPLFRPIILCLLLLCLPATFCTADDLRRSQDVMERYLATQTRWQNRLAELIIKERPEFTTIARAQRDHQLALIALKRARFAYLATHRPDQLDSGELGRLTNFTWSQAKTEAASAVDPTYLELEEQVARTRAINDKQPNWDEFRHYFNSDLSRSGDFRSLCI